MRRVALIGLFSLVISPAFAFSKITVDQLTDRVASLGKAKDKSAAAKLQNLQLTERLDPRTLSALLPTLPGDESRSALSVLADQSAFLPPPPAQIPSDPPPSPEQQQRIVAAMLEAAEHPDVPPASFDATRTITRYRNLKYLWGGHMDPIAIATPQPLYLSRSTDTLAYRQGETTVSDTALHVRFSEHVDNGVEDWDGFRRVLKQLTGDFRQVQPEWLRWETGDSTKLAVLRFTVTQDHSSLSPREALPETVASKWAKHSAYVCDVAIDPATGHIHRMVVRSTPNEKWLTRADFSIEFAPVPLAKGALLPARAILWANAQTQVGSVGSGYHTLLQWSSPTAEFLQLDHLAEVVFSDYRAPSPDEKPLTIPNRQAVWSALGTHRTRIPIVQLEQIVSETKGKPDAEFVDRLTQVELSQRLTDARFERLRAQLPGKASATALATLRDESEFQDMPPAEAVSGKSIDSAAQGAILQSAVQFVANVTHKLPDIFATRQLQRYEDLFAVRGIVQPQVAASNPFALIDESSGTIKVSEGREIVEPAKKGYPRPTIGLDTWGAFGPMLQTVMADVLQSKIGWSHWESGPTGSLAVFRYAVPEAAAHYDVRFCCYMSQDGVPGQYSATPAYHGEIAIDPRTGAVLRLVIHSDFKSVATPFDDAAPSPLKRSDVAVEYAPVNIGGQDYICPIRMVSVMTSWTLGLNGPLKTYVRPNVAKKIAEQAMKELQHSRVTAINEAAFTDYHVFRSEMRIVANSPH